MQAIFTKITIGFLLLTLIVGTGLTFIIDTANKNSITPDDIITNNNIAEQSNAARLILYSSNNQSQDSGLEAGSTDIAQAADSISVSDESIKISTVLTSFFDDLTAIIPISNFTVSIILAILVAIGVASAVYIVLGRNI